MPCNQPTHGGHGWHCRPCRRPPPPALFRPTTSASRRSCNRRGPGLPQPAKPSTARAADRQSPLRPVLSRQPPAANHLPPAPKQCTLSGYEAFPIPRNAHRLARPHSRSTPPAPPPLPAPGDPVDPCTLGHGDPTQRRRPACPEPVEGREPSSNHEIRRNLPPPTPRPQALEPHARPHPDLPGVPNPQSARITCRPVTPTARAHNPRRHPKNRQSSHPPGRNPPQGFRPGGCAFPQKPAASAHLSPARCSRPFAHSTLTPPRSAARLSPLPSPFPISLRCALASPLLHRPPHPPKKHPAAPPEFFRKNSYAHEGPRFTAQNPPEFTRPSPPPHPFWP